MSAIPGRRALRYWQRNADVFRATWKTTVLPPLFEPLLYLVAFGAGVGMLVGSLTWRGEELTYIEFVGPGMIAVGLMFWAFFETTYNAFIRYRFQDTMEAVMTTPLTAEEIVFGEILWGATKGLVAGTVTGGVVAALGLVSWPQGLWILAVLPLGGLVFGALGMICSGLVRGIDAFNIPIFLMVWPMYLFSGTFFPLEVMPGWARVVAEVLPLTHLVELLRSAALGRLEVGHRWDVGWLVG
jgi:lipooligosaccharide transport system permease protein